MRKMIEALREFFQSAKGASEQDRELKFLSQAQSHVQLELLQREWDKMSRMRKW
jgi:hypothetical protein